MKLLNTSFSILLIFFHQGYSQNSETQLTNFATITFPGEVEITETGFNTVYLLENEMGVFMVTTKDVTNQGLPSNDATGLLEFFEGIAKGTVNSSKGKLVSTKKVDLGDSFALDIEYTSRANPDLPFRRFKRVFLTYNTLFNIDYWPIIENEESIQSQKLSFFNSFEVDQIESIPVKTSNKDSSLVEKETPAYKIGFIVGQIMFYIILIAIPVFIILFFVRRSKKQKRVFKDVDKIKDNKVIEITCDNCNSANPSNLKYCKYCGFKLK